MIEVRYLDHMGSDHAVANDARISFARQTQEFGERDKSIIDFLASHKHWTPFGHQTVKLYIKAPIFVMRQVDKHQMGFTTSEDDTFPFVTNEVSRRYVKQLPEVYFPEVWRKAAPDKKQGSLDEEVNPYLDGRRPIKGAYEKLTGLAIGLYQELIEHGVCPEQARILLPQSTYTEIHKTGNLWGWANFYNLRSAPDAQRETQEVAQKVREIIEPLFPYSWQALTSGA